MKIATALLLVALAFPGPASAKGPVHARICGATGCEKGTLDAAPLWPDGAPPQTPPLGPAPSLTVTLRALRFRYVPSLRLIRVDYGTGYSPYWRRAPEPVLTALEPYVRRLGLLR